jgi:hypothetical protein
MRQLHLVSGTVLHQVLHLHAVWTSNQSSIRKPLQSRTQINAQRSRARMVMNQEMTRTGELTALAAVDTATKLCVYQNRETKSEKNTWVAIWTHLRYAWLTRRGNARLYEHSLWPQLL